MSSNRPPGDRRVYQRQGSSRPIQQQRPPSSEVPRRRRRKRKNHSGLVLLASVMVVVCIASALLAVNAIMSREGTSPSVEGGPNSGGAASLPVSSTVVPAEPTQRNVSFSAVGDNLIHDGIYLQAADRAGGNGYDFSYVYENLTYFFEPYDVNWINQETLVNNTLAPSSYPMFSTPGPLGQAAYDAGWRVFALSNNHTYDKGAEGIAATMDFWAGMPDDVVTPGLFTGNDEQDIKLQVVNDMTIAYVSYTQYTNGLPTPEGAPAWIIYTSKLDNIQRQVQRARELADAVVVGVHWGVENSHDVDDGQRALAASLVEWGADVIIGTHPHVIQSMEWMTDENSGRKALVIYSLGNFLSAQSQANQLVGLCVTFDLSQTVEADGTAQPVEVQNVHAYPVVTHYDGGYANIRDYMYRDYTPELAAQHGVLARYPGFTKEWIQQLLQTYIDPEFLVLE